MEPVESKAYEWKWVTGDQVLSVGPCEVCYAHLVVSAANGAVTLYDGENTAGEQIVKMQAAGKTGMQFHPMKPIYCRRGLYADVGSNVTGAFIQYRTFRE